MAKRIIRRISMLVILLSGFSFSLATANAATFVEIRSAQQDLQTLGYQPGEVDGLMGPRTRAAIEEFQRDFSLPATGTLGPRTKAQLRQTMGQLAATTEPDPIRTQEPVPPPAPQGEPTPKIWDDPFAEPETDAFGRRPLPPGQITPALNLSLYAELGYTYGGDKLAGFRFRDGDTDSIRAGSGVYIAAGPHLRLSKTPLALKATIGFHGDSVAARNGDASLQRVVIEAGGTWFATADHQFDLSYIGHRNIEFRNEFEPAANADFEDANGIKVAYRWRYFGALYQSLDYDLAARNGQPRQSFDAEGFGVFISTVLW